MVAEVGYTVARFVAPAPFSRGDDIVSAVARQLDRPAAGIADELGADSSPLGGTCRDAVDGHVERGEAIDRQRPAEAQVQGAPDGRVVAEWPERRPRFAAGQRPDAVTADLVQRPQLAGHDAQGVHSPEAGGGLGMVHGVHGAAGGDEIRDLQLDAGGQIQRAGGRGHSERDDRLRR